MADRRSDPDHHPALSVRVQLIRRAGFRRRRGRRKPDDPRNPFHQQEPSAASRASTGIASRETGTDMTFSVFVPPQAEGGAKLPGRLVSVGPHLHPRQRHRERRISPRLRRAGPDLRRARHQPARRRTCPTTRPMISARAPASTSTRPQAPFDANYRMYSYVAEELPALIAAAFPGRHGPPGDHRPFDGRPWRAHPRAAQSRPLPQRLRLRADRRAGPGAVGREGARPLSRRRPRRLAARTTRSR